MLLNDILQLVVLLDNYTTIGPSDRDSNLKNFFNSLNSVYPFRKEDRRNSEEIGQYFHFYFFIWLNFH